MKNSSNTETELKKSVAYKEKRVLYSEGTNSISGCNIANGWFLSTKSSTENHL